jgi:signal transduction histidine kinase
VPVAIDMTDLMKNVLDIHGNMFKSKHIQVELKSKTSFQVWGDQNSIETIFRNLINNALKFTPPGGKVYVNIESDDPWCVIKIEDTGSGMSKNDVTLFNQSNTPSRKYGTSGESGLGLGLKLVLDFIQINKGDVSVDSVEKGGTIFTVKLPVVNNGKVV